MLSHSHISGNCLEEIDEIDELLQTEVDKPTTDYKKKLRKALLTNIIPKAKDFDSGEYYKELDLNRRKTASAEKIIESKTMCQVVVKGQPKLEINLNKVENSTGYANNLNSSTDKIYKNAETSKIMVVRALRRQSYSSEMP